jgi:hypothetical protein
MREKPHPSQRVFQGQVTPAYEPHLPINLVSRIELRVGARMPEPGSIPLLSWVARLFDHDASP